MVEIGEKQKPSLEKRIKRLSLARKICITAGLVFAAAFPLNDSISKKLYSNPYENLEAVTLYIKANETLKELNEQKNFTFKTINYPYLNREVEKYQVNSLALDLEKRTILNNAIESVEEDIDLLKKTEDYIKCVEYERVHEKSFANRGYGFAGFAFLTLLAGLIFESKGNKLKLKYEQQNQGETKNA